MRRTAFLLDVTDEDVLDVWFDVDAGRITAFSVNYRALIQGEWRQVIRYDTAPEHLHVHEFFPPGNERIHRLAKGPLTDYTQALDDAMDDLSTNRRRHRRLAQGGA
jgi:hypothetical protein